VRIDDGGTSRPSPNGWIAIGTPPAAAASIKREEMLDRAVHAAVGEQPQQVQPAAGLS
jgi:hypothetical protein